MDSLRTSSVLSGLGHIPVPAVSPSMGLQEYGSLHGFAYNFPFPSGLGHIPVPEVSPSMGLQE